MHKQNVLTSNVMYGFLIHTILYISRFMKSKKIYKYILRITDWSEIMSWGHQHYVYLLRYQETVIKHQFKTPKQ